MKLLENYERAKNEIYKHVGFVEDWVVYPIVIQTDMYWRLESTEVVYALTVDDLEDAWAGNYYYDDIYTQRFYKKHVYEGEDFTMIFCDPHVDGMKWFRIFDNKKRVM